MSLPLNMVIKVHDPIVRVLKTR